MGVQTKILNRTYTAETVTASDGTTYTVAGKTGALALGVPGNIFDASPARIHTDKLDSDTAVAFGTFVSGKGVVVNPREGVLTGKDGDPLAASLKLAPGDAASFMTFGHVLIYCRDFTNVIGNGKMDGSELFGYTDCWVKGIAKSATVCLAVPSTAPAFSESTAYEVGDFVTYNSVIYMCKATHAAGEWNADHFATTVGTPSDDFTGSGANVGNLYKFYDDNVCAVELNGFKAAS